MTTIDDSTAVALGMLSFLLFVVLYVWTSLALAAVFRKSGEEGWKGWVPILNQVVLLQLGALSGWLLLLYLIPIVGPLIVWAMLIVAYHRINLAFGHGAGMTVLAALLLPVWASILGFGPARWLGAETPTGAYRTAPRSAMGGGPHRSPSVDDAGSNFVPRVSPPVYDPAQSLPTAPVGGWTPPPVPPAPARPPAAVIPPIPPMPGAPVASVPSAAEPLPDADPPPAFAPAPTRERSARDWGAFDLGAVSEVTSEVTAADSAAPAPISAVPHSEPDEAVVTAAPLVTRIPAMPARMDDDEPWAPARSPMADPDAFPDTSGQVSAVVGSANNGTPRSALGAVSAQYKRPEIPDDPIDETIITRRRRTAWSLIPPSGGPVPLTGDVVILGRKPDLDRSFPGAQLISIDDGTVSKTHARLALRDDRWYVTDLGSTNGVLFATLMGTEVEATPGEEIEAGERFFLGDAEVRLQRSDG